MITLHHSRGARSFRVLWALEELGLPYELRMLVFPPRQTTPGWLEENPLGTVPLLTDGAVRMTESAAICHYLATAHAGGALAVAPGDVDYAAYLNLLVMGEATFTVPQTTYLRYARMEPEARRVPHVAEDAVQWFAARLRAAVPLLGPEFACAGRFTMADVSIGYAAQLATAIGLKDAMPVAFLDHFERMRAREGYRRAREAERRA